MAAQGFLHCSSLLSADIRWSGSLACFHTVLMSCSLNRLKFYFFPCLWLSLHLIQRSRYDRPYVLPCGHNICWLPAKTGTGCMSYFHGCITLVTHRLLVESSYIMDLLVLPVVWPALGSSVIRMGYRNRSVYHPEDKLGVYLLFPLALWGRGGREKWPIILRVSFQWDSSKGCQGKDIDLDANLFFFSWEGG